MKKTGAGSWCNILGMIFIFFLSACAAPSAPPPSSTMVLKSLGTRVQVKAEIPARDVLQIAVDPDDRLVALKKDGRLEVIGRGEEKGKMLSARIGPKGAELQKPSGLAAGVGGICVADAGRHGIHLFNFTGDRIDGFGTRGNSSKAFDTPLGVAVFNDLILVVDSGNRRIQVFMKSGEFVASLGPVLAIKDEKAKKAILEKPVPKDPAKDELERIKLILQKKPPGEVKPQAVVFRNPIDVAVDFRGLVYVVDAGDNTVKVLDLNGEYIDQLPKAKIPYAVAAARDGVYLADREDLVINKYGFDLQLLYAFGGRGVGRGQFGAVDDIAVGTSGDLFVADGKRSVIHQLQLEQSPYQKFWTKIPPPSSIRWIRDLSINAPRLSWDGNKTLYAADGSAAYRIRDGKIDKIPTPAGIIPVSVAWDPKGFLWVLDGAEKQAIQIDEAGKVTAKAFVLDNKTSNRTAVPKDIAVGRKGVISMVDSGNRWVWLQAFRPDGSMLSTVIRKDKTGNMLSGPIALSLDSQDNLYVLDEKTLQVHIYTPSGEPSGMISLAGKAKAPSDLSVMHKEIYITDVGTDSIQVYDTQGKLLREMGLRGSGKGDFIDPSGIAVSEDLVLFVSDSGNGRLQVLQQVLTPGKPVEVTAAPGFRKVDLSWKKSSEIFPVNYKIYRTLSIDEPFEYLGSTQDYRFVDQDVAGGQRYFYRVSAEASGGNESLPTQPIASEPAVYTPQAPKNLKATGMEWSVNITWASDDAQLVKEYVVYRQTGSAKYEIGRTKNPEYKEQSLSPDTAYTYVVTAVSTDHKEGPSATVAVKTRVATKDPIEIMVVEMQDIFSNAYKVYEEEGLGRIRIQNNSGDLISNLKIAFMVKEFMDFPSQAEIRDLEPGKTQDIVLKAVFNNKILDVTEDTPVQTEIRASYFYNNLPREFTRNYAANIYEKHRMMWNIPERFSVFVTPKDPVIIDFVRASVIPFGKTESAIQRAAIVFHALGANGITYLADPNNPYQVTSGKIDYVDYLQFPRETLKRKSGDCDDLVALYSASLESMGISTQAIEIPGHMLMMFSTDIEAGKSGDTMNGLFIIHQGRLWVPVETTLVGSSFMKAWEKGSASYYQWQNSGLEIIDIRTSWRQFKPASLPEIVWRPDALSKKSMEDRFGDELSSLKNMELKLKSKKYYDILASRPNDTYALMQIGIIHGKEGSTKEAIRAFNKILETDANNAAAINNMANVLYIEGRYNEAAKTYEKAGDLEPNDPLIWVNQARCYQGMKDLPQAKKAFQKAHSIDRSVAMRYRMMAIELLSGF